MRKNIIIETQKSLQKEIFVKFLVCFSFNLTITARSTYAIDETAVDRPFALKGLNEISHRVLACIMHSLDDTWVQSPESFWNLIFQLAKHYECVGELEDALNFSAERYGIES